MAYRLIELLPDTDRLVVRAGDNELAVMADGESPNLAVVTFQLLDVLELFEAPTQSIREFEW